MIYARILSYVIRRVWHGFAFNLLHHQWNIGLNSSVVTYKFYMGYWTEKNQTKSLKQHAKPKSRQYGNLSKKTTTTMDKRRSITKNKETDIKTTEPFAITTIITTVPSLIKNDVSIICMDKAIDWDQPPFPGCRYYKIKWFIQVYIFAIRCNDSKQLYSQKC